MAILKNALAVAAPAACLNRSRRSRVTEQDSTATDSDSESLSVRLTSSPTAKAPASQRLKQDFSALTRKMALFARKPTGRRPKGPCPLARRSELTGIESRDVLRHVSSEKRQMTPPAPKRPVLTDNHDK